MGLFRKLKAAFHDDWCGKCQTQMDETFRQLYMLPMTVGHYCSHKDPEYYKRSLRKVSRKADIPAGMYACGAIAYRCPQCGCQMVKLSIFLPVRNEEMYEDGIIFENGELDEWLFFGGGTR